MADVFKKFISTSLEYYNLDLYNYVTAPGISWDAMLKLNKVQLENISDHIDTSLLKKE